MSNIDKRALREVAEKALNARARLALMQSVFDDDGDDVKPEAQEDIIICVSFNDLTNPATVLALLDELEAKDRRIAEQVDIIAKQEKWIKDVEATMIAATDRAEAAEKRIAELEAREPDLYLCRVTRDGEELYSPCGRDYPRGRGYIAAAAGKGE